MTLSTFFHKRFHLNLTWWLFLFFIMGVAGASTAATRTPENGTVQEAFNDGATPGGWEVVNNQGDAGWRFDDPAGRNNLTGGTGGFCHCRQRL